MISERLAKIEKQVAILARALGPDVLGAAQRAEDEERLSQARGQIAAEIDAGRLVNCPAGPGSIAHLIEFRGNERVGEGIMPFEAIRQEIRLQLAGKAMGDTVQGDRGRVQIAGCWGPPQPVEELAPAAPRASNEE